MDSQERMMQIKKQLLELLREQGAVLAGVGDLSAVLDGPMQIGVSAAVPVPREIARDLETAPTLAYYEMYSRLNGQLDRMMEAGADFLRREGFSAQANTTTTVQMDDTWRTPLPHKTVATRAGLGWIGKNCLLVTEEYGSAIRLSSLITDAPLPPDPPVNQSRCGNCHICVDACPAHALRGALWTPGLPREELLCRESCKEMQLARMKAATGIETDLCGLCFAVCPYTRRYSYAGEPPLA